VNTKIVGLNCVVFGVLLYALSGQAHAAKNWEKYTSRFSGCSIDYPTDMFTPSRQIDGDGATSFTSGLADAGLVLAGSSNDKNSSVAEIVRTYLEQVKGESITYRRQGEGWAVYSGYRGGLIYYLKVVVSSDRRRACVLELKYPPAHKLDLDFVVAQMSKSLRLPQSGVAAR
jgi:hypothetical protein